jgi:hypothetical protein
VLSLAAALDCLHADHLHGGHSGHDRDFAVDRETAQTGFWAICPAFSRKLVMMCSLDCAISIPNGMFT